MIDSGWNPTILEDIRTMFADQVRFLEWSNKSGYDYRRSVGCFKQNLTVRDEIDLTKKSVTQDSYCSITFIIQFISCVTFTVCEI